MEVERNHVLEVELLNRVRNKWITPKSMPHTTGLIYCLTKSYYDQTAPLPPTDNETLLFSIGFALEGVWIRDENINENPPAELVEGIWMSPDYVTFGGSEMDLKSTRMRSSEDGTPQRGFSDGWQKQFMAYAYRWAMDKYGEIPAVVPYNVGILYLVGAELRCFQLTFTRQEILENMEYLKTRLNIYNAFAGTNSVPTPYAFNESWECKNCRYAYRCQAASAGDSMR